jgi:hypothetical protein
MNHKGTEGTEEEGRGKREEERGKRKEERGKRKEGNFSITSSHYLLPITYYPLYQVRLNTPNNRRGGFANILTRSNISSKPAPPQYSHYLLPITYYPLPIPHYPIWQK